MAALDETHRFELLQVRIDGLVQLEERLRHAIEQRDLVLVEQAEHAAIDRTRLGICRNGVHVVAPLVVVVAEARERRNHERGERAVDRAIDLHDREIGLFGALVIPGAPLCIREILVGLRALPAVLAECQLGGLDEPFVGCDDGFRVVLDDERLVARRRRIGLGGCFHCDGR